MKTSKAFLGGLQTLALATTLVSAPAFAETTPAASNTTAAPASSIIPRNFLSKFGIMYVGQYIGPSIGRPSEHLTNEYGLDLKETQYIASTISNSYKITDDVSAALRINFNYRPVIGQDLTMTDPALRLVNTKMYNKGSFNLLSDFRIYPGMTVASHKSGVLSGFRTTQSATYDVPNTRLTVGMAGYAYYNLCTEIASAQVNTLEGYLSPNLNYQISKKVAATLSYELDAVIKHNQTLAMDQWNNGGTDLMVGISWDPTPNFNFSPYLVLNPGGAVNLDSTSIGAFISAKLL